MSPLRTLSLLLLSLGLAGCDDLPGKPDPAHRHVRAEEVMDFDELFDKNCQGCHGPGGMHGAAPPIGHPAYQAWVDDARLRDVVRNGVAGTGMPAFWEESGGMLTEEQVDALVDGMREHYRKPDHAQVQAYLPPYEDRLHGEPGRGGISFGTHCAGCHGEDGRGGPDGASIVNDSYLALVSDAGLRTLIVIGRPDFGMPGIQHYTPAMRAQEVTDLVAWLGSHRTPHPGQLPPPAEPKLKLGAGEGHAQQGEPSP